MSSPLGGEHFIQVVGKSMGLENVLQLLPVSLCTATTYVYLSGVPTTMESLIDFRVVQLSVVVEADSERNQVSVEAVLVHSTGELKPNCSLKQPFCNLCFCVTPITFIVLSACKSQPCMTVMKISTFFF